MVRAAVSQSALNGASLHGRMGNARAKKSPSPATHFLNVDLDLYSKSDLQPFVSALGGRRLRSMWGGMGGGIAPRTFEIARNTKNADAAMAAFCGLIRSLPEMERALWDGATVRSFSVGVQAGLQPVSCGFVIQAKTVKSVSDLDGRIVFTIYAPAKA